LRTIWWQSIAIACLAGWSWLMGFVF